MAEQRVGVGEVRDGKDLKFGSSGETIAGEEVDSSGGDETSGEARDWKDLKFGSSGDKRSGEARDEKDLKFGDGVETADADEDVQKQDSIEFDDFLKSFLGGDYDVSPNDGGDYVPDIWYDSSSNVNLENLDFGSGGGSLGLEGQIKIRPYVGDANGDVNPHRIDGTCPRRIRLQRKLRRDWDGLGRNDDDFEPDTNRLDYFRVAPFDVHGDDDLGEIGNYGGGGGGGGDTARISISSNNGSGDGDRNDRDMMVRPTLDQERASTGAGGQRLPVGISSNNGRRNREILLDQERGSSRGAGYMTQQDFGSGGGYACRRIRLQRKIPSGWDGLGRNDDDFEPDTNRLDYFVVAPFDVAYGDDDLGEIGNYGGGGGGGGDTARISISSNNGSGDGDRNDRDMMVRPTLDQERASTGAGGQRLAVGISSNNGGGDDTARILISSNNGSGDGDRRDQERASTGAGGQRLAVGISSNNGRRNREILLGQERGSSGGAGYMTQQEPIGISSNNGSGEMVIQNFEQERGGGLEWWIGGGGLREKLWLLLALWKIV